MKTHLTATHTKIKRNSENVFMKILNSALLFFKPKKITYKKIITGCIVVLIGFSTILFFTNESMFPSGSPAGQTGSPGDGSDCSSCHGGSVQTITGMITLSPDVTGGYTPGVTYTVTVTLSGSTPIGFEVSPQNTAGALLGTLLTPGTGTKFVSSKYVTQTSAKSSSPAVWTFTWQAPAKGTGDVTFYGAGALSINQTVLSSLLIHENTTTCIAQTITFNTIPNKITTDADFTITATASSGLPVTYSVVSGPATVSGSTVHLTGTTGTVVIAANQAGNTTYCAAAQVTQSFTVSCTPQTITFNTIPGKITTDADFTISATASSALPVTYSIVSGPATVSGSTVHLTGTTGTVVIAANQAGNNTYCTATQATQSFNVSCAPQIITFNTVPSKITTDADFTITATSSAALPVTFSLVSGPATITGSTVHLTGTTGTVVIAANQAGNNTYCAASQVTQSFTVSCTPQSIMFNAIPNKITTDADFTIAATSSAALPVTFSLVSGPATVTGSTVHLSGTTGTVIIAANQAGNDTYCAANQVSQSFNVSCTAQTITFNTIPNKITTDADFTITASSGAALPVTFSLVSGPATVTGSTVHLTGTSGTVVIAANQSGNNTYCSAAQVTQSFDIACTPQTISFNTIPNKITTDADFELTASSGSGLGISYTVVSGPATVSGSTVHLNGTTGTVVIAASQAGNNTYCAATQVTQSFSIACTPQTITINSIPSKITTDPDFTITATTSSVLPVIFSIVSGPATVSGNTVHLTGTPGTVVIAANQDGNSTYCAATQVTQSFVVSSTCTSQTITFNTIPNKITTDADFTISAAASSALPLTFSVVSGPATVSGSTVHLTGTTGIVVIAANQGGNTTYCAATQVTQSFSVSCTPQTITFNTISNKITTDADFVLTATSSSGLGITYTIVSGPATVMGSTVHLTGTTGTVIIAASQAGNATYCPATQLTQSLTVSCTPQTIMFNTIPDKITTDTDFTVVATSSAALPVTFNLVSGPATVTGNTVDLTGTTGTVMIAANQSGNDTYCTATQILQSFTVSCTPQTITFNAISNKITTDADFTLSASAGSGLPITYAIASGPATITGSTVHLTGTTGTVVIAANQAGNNTYCAAPQETQTFTVSCTPQTITFNTIPGKITTDPDFTITATTSSALQVTFTVISGPAMITGSTIHLTDTTGNVVIAANQAGNNTYCAATQVTQSFTVSCSPQTITFNSIPNKITTDADFTITANASSALQVTFTVISGPAMITGSTIHLTDTTGTVVIAANQAGNNTYCAATQVTQSFTVSTVCTVTANSFPATICLGSSAILTASGVNNYMWSNGLGNGSSKTVSPTANTTYTVTGTETSSGCTNTAHAVINVNPVPDMPVITLKNDTLFSNAPAGNQWYNQAGLINNATGMSYIPKVSGNYYDIVLISGCTSPSSIVINVQVTGITDNYLKNLMIYPNPMKDQLVIQFNNSNKNCNVEILNLVGQIIQNRSINNSDNTLEQFDLSGQPAGIYFVKLQTADKSIIKKIIKE